MKDHCPARFKFCHRVVRHSRTGADPVHGLRGGRAAVEKGFAACQFGPGVLKLGLRGSKAGIGGSLLQVKFFIDDPGNDLSSLNHVAFGTVERGDRTADHAAGRHNKNGFRSGRTGPLFRSLRRA